MFTQLSFFNKAQCAHAAAKLRDAVDLHKSIDLNAAADQFEIHAARDGEYFSNIIKDSHYTKTEIDTILYRINP